MAARRRCSKPATTEALSFVGSSALAFAAAGTWPPEDPSVAEPDVVAEVEVPATIASDSADDDASIRARVDEEDEPVDPLLHPHQRISHTSVMATGLGVDGDVERALASGPFDAAQPCENGGVRLARSLGNQLAP